MNCLLYFLPNSKNIFYFFALECSKQTVQSATTIKHKKILDIFETGRLDFSAQGATTLNFYKISYSKIC